MAEQSCLPHISQESRRRRERKPGLRGGRQTERHRDRDTGIDRAFKGTLPTMLL